MIRCQTKVLLYCTFLSTLWIVNHVTEPLERLQGSLVQKFLQIFFTWNDPSEAVGSFQGVFHCDIIDGPQWCTLHLGVISPILICNSLKLHEGRNRHDCECLPAVTTCLFDICRFMTTYFFYFLLHTHTTLLHALMRH